MMFGSPTTFVPQALGPLETGPINFRGGIPIGGWAQLTLHNNGAYNYVGHFHNSGGVPYHVACVMAIRDGKGTAYTFTAQGDAHGWDPGSRDLDWTASDMNPAIAAGWGAFFEASGSLWNWNAAVTLDIAGLVDGVVKTLGPIGTIIAVI